MRELNRDMFQQRHSRGRWDSPELLRAEEELQNFGLNVRPKPPPKILKLPGGNQQTRVYPHPLGAGSARPNPKMGAPDPENLYF